MIYILNFNNSRKLEDIKFLYDKNKKTNINILLEDFIKGETEWSVPQKAVPGDIVIFMCAKTARNNLGLATSYIPDHYGPAFRTFVEEQKTLYKQYSGNLLGYGIVDSNPEYDIHDNRWYAVIRQLRQFPNPIYINEFRSFISISKTSSVTPLMDRQWEHLKWVVNKYNPGFFENVDDLTVELLNLEFEETVKKEGKKPLSKLKIEAEKKSSAPLTSVVHTKVYYRDPTIAAYVKKRAGGYCQLCGKQAPFIDLNGEPYLECHHIRWLSNGGMDSTDNCAALCPNCHRKMHLVNDPDDVRTLLEKIQS